MIVMQSKFGFDFKLDKSGLHLHLLFFIIEIVFFDMATTGVDIIKDWAKDKEKIKKFNQWNPERQLDNQKVEMDQSAWILCEQVIHKGHDFYKRNFPNMDNTNTQNICHHLGYAAANYETH